MFTILRSASLLDSFLYTIFPQEPKDVLDRKDYVLFVCSSRSLLEPAAEKVKSFRFGAKLVQMSAYNALRWRRLVGPRQHIWPARHNTYTDWPFDFFPGGTIALDSSGRVHSLASSEPGAVWLEVANGFLLEYTWCTRCSVWFIGGTAVIQSLASPPEPWQRPGLTVVLIEHHTQ